MKVRILTLFVLAFLENSSIFTQTLPRPIKRYLDRNYRGWKLAGECHEEHDRVISGDFDGSGRRDYAIKFVRGDKGFMMAFLNQGKTFKPFSLHIYDADEARFSSLTLFKKGESYKPGVTPKLKFDSPADFHCESDVGGFHAYRNGKFIAY